MPSGQALIQEPNRAIASYIGIETTSSLPEESMEGIQWWIIDIVGPAILLLLLVWLVMKRQSNQTNNKTERATDDLYREEEQRRREGTDDL